MLFMRAGKGQQHHHRLRSKVLASMTPKRILALVPDMVSVVREELDGLAEATRTKGFATFKDTANHIATRVSGLPVVGGMEPTLRKEVETLFETWISGLISAPVDLGNFSTFGRAKKARRRLTEIVKGLIQQSHRQGEARSVVSELAAMSSDGTAFTDAEIVDTIFTLLFAGQFTTSESLPGIIVELAARDDWRAKIAAEPLEFMSVEGDSAALRFVRECLRYYPPEVLFTRQNRDMPVDLGQHGTVPLGCNIAVNFGQHQWALGEDFDPDRWAEPSLERESFLTFGGHSPHSCVGRSVAMLEMQVFARIVSQEYDVSVVDSTLVRNWSLGGLTFMFKDGCKLKVKKRGV